LASSPGSLGLAYQEKGLHEKAIESIRKAQQLDPSNPYIISSLGYANALVGNRDAARAALAQLQEMAARRYVDPYDFARIQVGLGNRDEAFRQLERAIGERSEQLVFLRLDPQFDDLRSDQRLDGMLRRLGLEP
jgi:Flp pilus assembly protein TadD